MVDIELLQLLDEKLSADFNCSYCGAGDFYIIKTRGILKCKVCRRQSGLWAGTVFQDIKIPAKIIVRLLEILSVNNNLTTVELSKITGINQKSAWKFKSRVLPYLTDDPAVILHRVFKSQSDFPFKVLIRRERAEAVKQFDEHGYMQASAISVLDKMTHSLETTIKRKRFLTK